MKVLKKYTGLTHALGYCTDCSWGTSLDDDAMTLSNIKNDVIEHVKKTGHWVTFEQGNSTRYHPEPTGIK